MQLDCVTDALQLEPDSIKSHRPARVRSGFCSRWSGPRPIAPSNFWAADPSGIDQFGCVYTAQGFEFDYVSVIFGRTCAGIPPPRTGSAILAPATTPSSSALATASLISSSAPTASSSPAA